MNQFEVDFKTPNRRYAIYPIIHDRIARQPDSTDSDEKISNVFNFVWCRDLNAPELLAYYEKVGFGGVVGN
ncbi:MAG TPA: hypothetical protein PLK08_09045, partial [Phycisphaerae bacterium]|nr:hypothetical protein [Phycisphaerae bacterium]